MKYAVNSKEMKLIDQYTTADIKIPEAVLMERAAYEVAAVMKRQITKSDRILAVCGPGNNGGDGVAAGRILYLQGYHVALLFIGDKDKTSAGMKAQLEIAGNLGIPMENSNKLSEYNIIIDAIFGVGLSRPVTGEYEEIISRINAGNFIVFAVDIPSGVSSDNGKIMNKAIEADYTVTFGYQKQGLLLYPGTEYAGEIIVADIGFPEKARKQARTDTFYYEPEDLRRLPKRKDYSNKGTFGKVLIIAGSKGMSGAAYFSAKAAYRMGAGLVKVLTSEENRIILQSSLPEALFSAYDEEPMGSKEIQLKMIRDLSWASVIVIGPGLGLSQTSLNLLEIVLKNAKAPIIVDADGITLLSKMLDNKIKSGNILSDGDSEVVENNIDTRLKLLASFCDAQIIVTPHLMELSRLIGIPISDIVGNFLDTAKQCSYNNNLIYAIKDARSIVAQSDRKYINVSGNNGMATGGSGDVLTGMIAALIAQGMSAYEAACLAVYLHGLAGDTAAKEKSSYSMIASDIIDSIEKVILTASELS